MTLDQLIQRAKDSLNAKINARNDLTTQLNTLRAGEFTAEAEKALVDQRGAIDAQKVELEARLAMYEAEKIADEAARQLQSEVTPIGQRAGDGQTQTRTTTNARTNEPRTYTRETSAAGVSYFSDVWKMQQKHDTNATARIERHAKEVEVEGELTERATTTGSFAGLIIPQYLPQMAALALRAGRPLANICNRQQIPADGMSFVIQRGTTGAATAVQATENTAATSTDEVWTDLTVPVRTIAGQQQVSRQSLERGTGVDSIIYLDLARAYAANLDNQLINGTGASGQVLGILNTGSISAATAFGAVPGLVNFNLKIAGQIAAVASAGVGLTPRVLVMHPRRWGWYTAQMDSTNRPVVLSSALGPMNANGLITVPGGYSGDEVVTMPVGAHSSGLPVVTDLNIPITVGTNSEDVILALETQEMWLWEDGDGMPKELRFEQTLGNQLTTTLVVYGYVAFTAGRYPGATGKIGGLDSTATFGLVAPAF